MAATYRGRSVAADLFARPQSDRPHLRGEDRRSSRAPRMRSASAAAWRRSPRPCSTFVEAGRPHRLRRALSIPTPIGFFETLLEALRHRRRPMSTARDRDGGRGGAARRRLFYLESPTSWIFETHDRRARSPRSPSATTSSPSSTTAGRRRSSSSRSRSASISSSIRPRNISAATPTWWRASSPGRRELIGTDPAATSALSRRQAVALRRLAAAARPAHPADPHARARGRAACRSRGVWPRIAAVARVHHPAPRQPLPEGLTGTSGLFSFEFAPGIDIPAFCDTLRAVQARRQLGRP